MGTLAWMLAASLGLGSGGEAESVAVIPLIAKRVPKETVAVLDDLLLTSIGQTGKYRPLGPSDINAMIGMEKMKEVLGCDDVGCAIEIGGALGVGMLVTGSVSRLGSNVIVTLSLIDAKAHAVKRRSKAQVRDDENLYLQAIDMAVCQLFEQQPDCAAAAGANVEPASPGATASPRAAASTHAAVPPPERVYRRYENGRLVNNASGMRWADAVADCLDSRRKYDKTLAVTCDFDGKRMGYELFWDDVLAGYEPGWDFRRAKANCLWNISTHKDKHIECRFDGQTFDPYSNGDPPAAPSGATGRGYEVFFNGRLAKSVAGMSHADALADCIAARDRFDKALTVTCDFGGKRMGYELFWDDVLAGYEPGWDLQKARSNCAWNADAHRERRVECYFEGKRITTADEP